jgi:hypothetical protein
MEDRLVLEKQRLKDIATQNTIKKNRFLKLCQQLDTGKITEADYDREIETREDDYVIYCNEKVTSEKISLIKEILIEWNGVYIHSDEIAEIFGLDIVSLNKFENPF